MHVRKWQDQNSTNVQPPDQLDFVFLTLDTQMETSRRNADFSSISGVTAPVIQNTYSLAPTPSQPSPAPREPLPRASKNPPAHEKKNCKCNTCTVDFSKLRNRQKRIRKSSKSVSYYCRICNIRVSRLDHLKRHFKSLKHLTSLGVTAWSPSRHPSNNCTAIRNIAKNAKYALFSQYNSYPFNHT